MFLSYIRLMRGLPKTQHPYSTEAQLELPVSAVSLLDFFFCTEVNALCETFVCLCWLLVAVKSFLERFGERCQEHKQNSPSTLGGQGHTPVATPSATPKSRLLQERLGCTQATSTTAVLTQKQKMACINFKGHICWIAYETSALIFYLLLIGARGGAGTNS